MNFYGVPIYGNPVVFLRYFYGISTGFLWDFQDNSVIFPWGYCGISIFSVGFLWDFFVVSMIFAFVSMIFLWIYFCRMFMIFL